MGARDVMPAERMALAVEGTERYPAKRQTSRRRIAGHGPRRGAVSGILQDCPRCGSRNVRLIVRHRDNATICTACIDLPDSEFVKRETIRVSSGRVHKGDAT